MRGLFCLLILVTFSLSASANNSILLKHKYEDIFPAGVEGNDWFSKLAYGGHKLRLVKEGKDVVDARVKLIQSATRSILFSTFIYDTDQSSTIITANLCVKARHGVDVRMIVDSKGAGDFYKKHAGLLRSCGVGIQLFRPGYWDALKVVQVMHEKLLIIDGHTVYMGGRGVQNSYHSMKPAHKFFHDIDVIIEGPVACWWQFKYIDNYHKARLKNEPCRKSNSECRPRPREIEERLFGRSNYPACYPVNAGSSRVIPIYGNPFFDKSKTPIEDVYIKALENLKEGDSVKLYSPYFVPSKRFGAALVKAKKEKKADIEIITNSLESNDEGAAVVVAMSYEAEYIMKAGIKIRLYPGPMTLHRKAGVFAGKYAHIGSDNLDNRGQHYQTESVIMTDDAEIADEITEEFEKDFAKSRPLTPKEIERIRDAPNFFTHFFSKTFRKFF